jgi:hypothetical protein
MQLKSENKAMALARTVGEQAQALRSLLRRNPGPKAGNAIRRILEAHEGYIAACEDEQVQRKITGRPAGLHR